MRPPGTKKSMPKGFRPARGDARPRVAVVFDEALFERIKAQATKDKKNFSVMVGELCKVGLLCLEESDALEPAA